MRNQQIRIYQTHTKQPSQSPKWVCSYEGDLFGYTMVEAGEIYLMECMNVFLRLGREDKEKILKRQKKFLDPKVWAAEVELHVESGDKGYVQVIFVAVEDVAALVVEAVVGTCDAQRERKMGIHF